MAKKTAKKIARKPATKAARKPAKKAPKKAAGPRAVSTGKGLTPLEVGSKLVANCNAGQWGLSNDLWSKNIVSVEGLGVSMAWEGRKAVDAKNADWSSTHKIHGGSAEGPYVGASGFAVKFTIDVEDIATGQRNSMVEIGVYTVQNGKIVREEFMYFAG